MRWCGAAISAIYELTFDICLSTNRVVLDTFAFVSQLNVEERINSRN